MNTELSTFHQQNFRVFNKKHIVSSLLFKYSYFTQKQTAKNPQSQIELAKRYRTDFFEKERHNE